MTHTTLPRLLAATTAALLLGSAAADEGRRAPTVQPLPAYAQECGACHLAYPPGLLPAASWQRLMGSLPRHFGSDASLDDAATARAVAAWLQANAGTHRRLRRDPAPPPEDRISRSAWFQREHREISPAVWQRKSVGSAARCDACHAGAARGDFDEHTVRIPQ